jgi:hypothetical protein
MSLAAPPQIDDTTPRFAFLISRSPAALLAAKSAQPDTGSRDAIPSGIPSWVCRPFQARRWMDAQNVTSPSAIRYIAIYA